MRRKILSLLLISSMLCAFVPTLAAQAATSGTCGANVTWTLDDDGTLTISGEGEMKNDYSIFDLPWYDSRSSIKKVVIEQGVTSIGEYTFCICLGLTNVTIPDSVTTIGDGAFANCENLTYVIIPNGVKIIGYRVFDGCTKLASVIIPKSVTEIGGYAFRSCTALTDITIPDSVIKIDNDAFENCSSLTAINVDNLNPSYCSIDGNMFDKNKETLIQYAIGKQENKYEIPDSVKSINDCAFAYCENLTSVIIPDGVISTGGATFLDCKNLTDITMPDSVITIGNSSFRGCSSLVSITLPSNVTTIEPAAFDYCDSLTTITIPNSVTKIDTAVFRGCDRLKDVYYTGTETEWNNIQLGYLNQPLLNATIHYGKFDQTTLIDMTVTPSEGTYSITADTSHIGTAYAAVYDAEGRLINVVSAPFEDGTATVTPNMIGASHIKFFVWTNTLQPITNTVTKEL